MFTGRMWPTLVFADDSFPHKRVMLPGCMEIIPKI